MASDFSVLINLPLISQITSWTFGQKKSEYQFKQLTLHFSKPMQDDKRIIFIFKTKNQNESFKLKKKIFNLSDI